MASVYNPYTRLRDSTTTNKYFNFVNSTKEQELYNSLIKECVSMTGIDVWYLPRKYVMIDPVLGEPLKSSFDKGYKIEAYIESASDGYEGEDIATKFGVGAGCEVTLIISKKKWRELNVTEMIYNRPQEGDLIFIGSGSSEFSIDYFEITYVDYQKYFFQLGKSMVYALKCVAFTYNYEEFDVQQENVDEIVKQTNNESELELAQNSALDFLEPDLLVMDEDNPFR